MSNHKIFNVEHYLVSIEYEGNVTRLWDVYIASNGEEYYGKAEMVNDKGGMNFIPWLQLENKDVNLLDELLPILKKAY
ncbi:hypothetical protein [Peribacillus frigoritolerans]|uniref:hypothetical protein n=1 Tax=Peribacillus frigoritolerans TaxID=450367 RepID=UPI0033060CBC